MYSHLNQFDVADMAQSIEVSSPEVLIGSDCYWQLVTGKVVRGDSGPVALLGWAQLNNQNSPLVWLPSH